MAAFTDGPVQFPKMKAFASLHIQHQKTDVFHCLPGSLGHWVTGILRNSHLSKYSTVPAPMQLMWSNLSNGPSSQTTIRKVDSFHKCLSYVLNSRSLLTGLDENYMFCSIVFFVATGHLCRWVSELRCRQSAANEERLVRLQTVLKPVSLGGMDDGLHRRTVGLKFEDYLMAIWFFLLVAQYPFWWCKNTTKKHDMIDKKMLDAFFVWKNWTHEVDVLHKICAELTGT